MLKLRIIPTLLYKNLKLVKGVNFNSWRTTGSIMTAVKVYNMRQVDELILLNISATNLNQKIDLELVNDIANECFMPLTIGGGIQTIEDISNLLKAGADKVCINTAATKSLDFIRQACEVFGSQSIVVSVDYKVKDGKILVFSNSGEVSTNLDFKKYLKDLEESGVGEFIITSIDRDGTMKGYDIETLKIASELVNVPVIASGGAGEFENILELVKETDVSALAAARIYHFTVKTPRDLKVILKENRIPVRI